MRLSRLVPLLIVVSYLTEATNSNCSLLLHGFSGISSPNAYNVILLNDPDPRIADQLLGSSLNTLVLVHTNADAGLLLAVDALSHARLSALTNTGPFEALSPSQAQRLQPITPDSPSEAFTAPVPLVAVLVDVCITVPFRILVVPITVLSSVSARHPFAGLSFTLRDPATLPVQQVTSTSKSSHPRPQAVQLRSVLEGERRRSRATHSFGGTAVGPHPVDDNADASPISLPRVLLFQRRMFVEALPASITGGWGRRCGHCTARAVIAATAISTALYALINGEDQPAVVEGTARVPPLSQVHVPLISIVTSAVVDAIVNRSAVLTVVESVVAAAAASPLIVLPDVTIGSLCNGSVRARLRVTLPPSRMSFSGVAHSPHFEGVLRNLDAVAVCAAPMSVQWRVRVAPTPTPRPLPRCSGATAFLRVGFQRTNFQAQGSMAGEGTRDRRGPDEQDGVGARDGVGRVGVLTDTPPPPPSDRARWAASWASRVGKARVRSPHSKSRFDDHRVAPLLRQRTLVPCVLRSVRVLRRTLPPSPLSNPRPCLCCRVRAGECVCVPKGGCGVYRAPSRVCSLNRPSTERPSSGFLSERSSTRIISPNVHEMAMKFAVRVLRPATATAAFSPHLSSSQLLNTPLVYDSPFPSYPLPAVSRVDAIVAFAPSCHTREIKSSIPSPVGVAVAPTPLFSSTQRALLRSMISNVRAMGAAVMPDITHGEFASSTPSHPNVPPQQDCGATSQPTDVSPFCSSLSDGTLTVIGSLRLDPSTARGVGAVEVFRMLVARPPSRTGVRPRSAFNHPPTRPQWTLVRHSIDPHFSARDVAAAVDAAAAACAHVGGVMDGAAAAVTPAICCREVGAAVRNTIEALRYDNATWVESIPLPSSFRGDMSTGGGVEQEVCDGKVDAPSQRPSPTDLSDEVSLRRKCGSDTPSTPTSPRAVTRGEAAFLAPTAPAAAWLALAKMYNKSLGTTPSISPSVHIAPESLAPFLAGDAVGREKGGSADRSGLIAALTAFVQSQTDGAASGGGQFAAEGADELSDVAAAVQLVAPSLLRRGDDGVCASSEGQVGVSLLRQLEHVAGEASGGAAATISAAITSSTRAAAQRATAPRLNSALASHNVDLVVFPVAVAGRYDHAVSGAERFRSGHSGASSHSGSAALETACAAASADADASGVVLYPVESIPGFARGLRVLKQWAAAERASRTASSDGGDDVSGAISGPTTAALSRQAVDDNGTLPLRLWRLASATVSRGTPLTAAAGHPLWAAPLSVLNHSLTAELIEALGAVGVGADAGAAAAASVSAGVDAGTDAGVDSFGSGDTNASFARFSRSAFGVPEGSIFHVDYGAPTPPPCPPDFPLRSALGVVEVSSATAHSIIETLSFAARVPPSDFLHVKFFHMSATDQLRLLQKIRCGPLASYHLARLIPRAMLPQNPDPEIWFSAEPVRAAATLQRVRAVGHPTTAAIVAKAEAGMGVRSGRSRQRVTEESLGGDPFVWQMDAITHAYRAVTRAAAEAAEAYTRSMRASHVQPYGLRSLHPRMEVVVVDPVRHSAWLSKALPRSLAARAVGVGSGGADGFGLDVVRTRTDGPVVVTRECASAVVDCGEADAHPPRGCRRSVVEEICSPAASTAALSGGGCGGASGACDISVVWVALRRGGNFSAGFGDTSHHGSEQASAQQSHRPAPESPPTASLLMSLPILNATAVTLTQTALHAKYASVVSMWMAAVPPLSPALDRPLHGNVRTPVLPSISVRGERQRSTTVRVRGLVDVEDLVSQTAACVDGDEPCEGASTSSMRRWAWRPTYDSFTTTPLALNSASLDQVRGGGGCEADYFSLSFHASPPSLVPPGQLGSAQHEIHPLAVSGTCGLAAVPAVLWMYVAPSCSSSDYAVAQSSILAVAFSSISVRVVLVDTVTGATRAPRSVAPYANATAQELTFRVSASCDVPCHDSVRSGEYSDGVTGHPPALGSVTPSAPAYVLTAPYTPPSRCVTNGHRGVDKSCHRVQHVVWGVLNGDATAEVVADWVLQHIP